MLPSDRLGYFSLYFLLWLDIMNKNPSSLPACRFLLQATRFFHADPYAALLARLRSLQLDYGEAFHSELIETGGTVAELRIHSCLYADIFAEEGASGASLLACCCCSQDKVWIEGVQFSSARGALVESRSSGTFRAGGSCCFRVERTAV